MDFQISRSETVAGKSVFSRKIGSGTLLTKNSGENEKHAHSLK